MRTIFRSLAYLPSITVAMACNRVPTDTSVKTVPCRQGRNQAVDLVGSGPEGIDAHLVNGFLERVPGFPSQGIFKHGDHGRVFAPPAYADLDPFRRRRLRASGSICRSVHGCALRG